MARIDPGEVIAAVESGKRLTISPDDSFRFDCSSAYELVCTLKAYGTEWYMAMHSPAFGLPCEPLFSSPSELVLAGSREQLARTLFQWDEAKFEYRGVKAPEGLWPEIHVADMAWHWDMSMPELGYQFPNSLQGLAGDLTAQEVKCQVFPMVVSELEDVCTVLTPGQLRRFVDGLPSLSVTSAIEALGLSAQN